ncbi:MAG: sigma-70 family RNA polymerase sigma factor [Chloroflexota bacterium]|nr:sigma-70 family RNA polymerase sigma factor [Chloroflexota bacterium]
MLVLNALEPAGPPVSAARFDDLFRRLYPGLLGLAARLLGERAEAEDVVQEAFLKLADDAVLARPDDEVAAWMRRVVLNLGTNRLRDRRRAADRLERAGRLGIALVDGEADGPAREVLRHEAREQVRAALDELPDRQRACLLLRHAGHSYAEIAATLGIAVGSVGVLLARAERAFGERYRARYPEPRHGVSPSDETRPSQAPTQESTHDRHLP